MAFQGRTGLTRSEIACNPYRITTGLLEGEVACQIGFKGLFRLLIFLQMSPLVALIRQRSKPYLHVGIHGSIWQMERHEVRGSNAPGRADEPLHAFGDVFPQAAANGELDGAPSGSHVDPQFSITTTVC